MTARETLDGIRAQLAAATPGPWRLDREEPGEVAAVVAYAHNDGVTIGTYIADVVEQDGDAEFIAAAPATVARLSNAVEAVLALAEAWEARGEHDMAYSKTVPDEDIAMTLLTDGAAKVENARHVRNAIEKALKEGQ